MNIVLPIVKPIEFTKAWSDFRVFAIRQHKGQMYGDLPYAYHLSMVEAYLDEFGYDDWEYRCAGWCHDIVEDTLTTPEELSLLFTPHVASLVWACTGVGSNRSDKAKEIYRRLKEYPLAAPVKVADRMANMLHGLETANVKKLSMYLDEWSGFKENIKPLMTSTRDIWFFQTLENIVDQSKDEIEVLKLTDIGKEKGPASDG
jgi:(p)ppGpp synthase/HD superfamily hydrolase